MDPFTDQHLTATYAKLSPSDAWHYRMQLEHRAQDAYDARPDGDTRNLADYQQAEVDAELLRCAESEARNAAGRARIFGPPEALEPLNVDDPASLAAHGMPFAARALRTQRAADEHTARRRRIEVQVASDERVHQRLRSAGQVHYGRDVA